MRKKSFKRSLENWLDEGWDWVIYLLLLIFAVFNLSLWLKVFKIW